MKNEIFLWCRYRGKNLLKTVCTLKCKSTRLWNDNEFMPSSLHAFLWRTSILFVTSLLTTQIRYEFCWKKKKKKKLVEIMQGCTLKRIMLCQIKFGLLFKISNYRCCVFISRQCRDRDCDKRHDIETGTMTDNYRERGPVTERLRLCWIHVVWNRAKKKKKRTTKNVKLTNNLEKKKKKKRKKKAVTRVLNFKKTLTTISQYLTWW